jgi:hypothetical protein
VAFTPTFTSETRCPHGVEKLCFLVQLNLKNIQITLDDYESASALVASQSSTTPPSQQTSTPSSQQTSTPSSQPTHIPASQPIHTPQPSEKEQRTEKGIFMFLHTCISTITKKLIKIKY